MYFSSPGPAGPCRLDNSVSFKERERRILGSSSETKKIVDVGKQLKCQVFYHNQLYRIKKTPATWSAANISSGLNTHLVQIEQQ